MAHSISEFRNEALPPKQRLASSRAALLAAMGYREPGIDANPRSAAHGEAHHPRHAASRSKLDDWLAQSVVGHWWRRSHLSTVAEIGRPFLQEYASRHPAKLVAYAAGTGSLIVVVRPWRLLSIGMIAGLLLRSTDVQGFLSDCLVPQLGDTDGPRDDFLDSPPR